MSESENRDENPDPKEAEPVDETLARRIAEHKKFSDEIAKIALRNLNENVKTETAQVPFEPRGTVRGRRGRRISQPEKGKTR